MNQEIRLDLQQNKIRILQEIVTLNNSGISVQKKTNSIGLFIWKTPKINLNETKQKKEIDELLKIF